MAKKIQLQDANGNVLHPLTLGGCVTMDNGENLDTLMSKSQMFTPTITQDKSMFKVGTGVDVDYSANVKDGAYESLVFKGKTLSSLIDFKGKFQRTTGTLVERTQGTITFTTSGTGKFNLGCKLQLKPNTKYLLRAKTTSAYDVNMFVLDVGKNVYIMGHTTIPSATEIVTTFATNNEITDNINFSFSRQVTQGDETITGHAMIVEYDDSMETNSIPLFEGLCDSKMPILRNVGKNLFDVNLLKGLNSNVVVTDGIVTINNAYSNGLGVNGKKAFWFLKPNKTYRYSCAVTNTGESNGLDGGFYFGKRLGDGTTTFFSIYPNRTVTIPSDWENYTTAIMYGALSNNGLVTVKNMQFEEADATTSYEPHKTNILRTSEEIVLREVNGVQDTYNPLTGEYVQRIGEIVLDGSEGWGGSGLENQEETLIFQYNVSSNQNIPNPKPSSLPICDKFASNRRTEDDAEGILRFNGTNGHGFYIRIQKSRLSTPDYIGFKQWLSQNPITVQYELEAPVTTIVKPSTMTPFAYQNGHVIVESGFEGQSLLPEIEYSVVTGRTGQVTQNTKVLRQQEQQIIGLEELLLTQVVQMEYERTLLQFDYELQMMMLG